jgi:hypothetical protein
MQAGATFKLARFTGIFEPSEPFKFEATRDVTDNRDDRF